MKANGDRTTITSKAISVRMDARSWGGIDNWHPVMVANSITAMKRDNTQNYVVVPANTADGEQTMEIGGICDLSYPSSKTRRGRVQGGVK